MNTSMRVCVCLLTCSLWHRVQWCSHLNQMQTQDLARVFSPCLFQTDGQNEQEASVVQDLINNYVQLFDVRDRKSVV